MLIVFVSTACELKLRQFGEGDQKTLVEIKRYDRLESRYLTTGDFSALQQMNIDYPMETRTLIEDVLQLGEVNDPGINSKFLQYYQDTTLQSIISEAELQYACVSDISKRLNTAFDKLRELCPTITIPTVYMQIGALDQSIVIGNNSIGISLDKYLGTDFLLYHRYYSEAQRQQMTRENIVPDCMFFYMLSLFPLKNFETRSQYERDLHVGKIMWIVNELLEKKFFNTKYVERVDRYVDKHSLSVKALLKNCL